MLAAQRVDRDRLLAEMLRLIAIDSPTGHEQEIGAHLRERLRGLGCAADLDEHGNLVTRYPGRRPGADTILLSPHMDTAGTELGQDG